MQNNNSNNTIEAALSNLWQVIKNVSEEIKLTKEEKQQFKEKADELENRLVSMDSEFKEFKEKLRNLHLETNEWKEQYQELSIINQSNLTEIERLNIENSKMEDVFKNNFSLQKQIEELEMQIQKSNELNDSISIDNSKLHLINSENEKLNNEIDRLKLVETDFSFAKEELIRKNHSIVKLSTEISGSKEYISELENQVLRLKSSIEKYQNQLKENDKIIKDYYTLKEEYELIKKENISHINQKEQLENKLEFENISFTKQIKELEENIEKLNISLKEADNNSLEKEKILSEYIQKIIELKQDNQANENRSNEFTEHLNTLKAEKIASEIALNEKVILMEEKINKLYIQRLELENEIEKLVNINQENEKNNALISQLEQKINFAEQEIQKKNSELSIETEIRKSYEMQLKNHSIDLKTQLAQEEKTELISKIENILNILEEHIDNGNKEYIAVH